MALKDFATVMQNVNRSTIITALPETPSMDTFRISMGPFPTRVRHAPDGQITLEAIVGAVRRSDGIFEAAQRVPFPQPSLTWTLTPEPVVSISYSTHERAFNQQEAIGLCAAGAMFAATLARELQSEMVPTWQRALAAHGIAPGIRPDDPRNLLKGSEIPAWSDWPAG